MADDRTTRTIALLADPDFLDKFAAHISNGGSGPDYCKDRDVRFSDVMAWINKVEDRRVMYAHAESARAQWFVQSILAELKNIGLVDIREAYNADNTLKDIKDIPAGVARCIVQVATEEIFEGVGPMREKIGETKFVKFSDKLRALELLGKNLQMFIDTSRVVHMGRVTLEDLVNASMAGPGEVTPLKITQEVKGELEESKKDPPSLEKASDGSSDAVHADGEGSPAAPTDQVCDPGYI